MKGSLVDKVPNIAVMLYLGAKFEGFYATNQEAWIAVMNQLTGTAAASVDIITIFNLGDGEIDIANVQSFYLKPPSTRVYSGRIRSEDGLIHIKYLAERDWKEAVTQ